MKSVIDYFVSDLLVIWEFMCTFPWPRPKITSGSRPLHVASWIVGWVWAIAGVFLGAFVAPSLIEYWELADTPYQDYVIVAVSALAGFAAQLAGWLPFIVVLPPVLRFDTWVRRKHAPHPTRA
jgi:hypothetical protein